MKPLALLLTCCTLHATMLVVHKHGDSLGFYNDAGQSVATVAVGKIPHEIALSADQKIGYVTNYGIDRYNETLTGGNTVSVIDLVARKSLGEIDLGQYHRPHGIERGRSGRLYVTVDQPASLLVIDPAQRKIVKAYPLEQVAPHMVELTANEDKAYIANAASGSVTVLLLRAGGKQKHLPVGGVPMGFALTSDGKTLYAATRTGNEVCIIDTAKDEIVKRLTVPGHPARVRLTKDEKHLLVSLIDSGDLAVLDTGTLKEVKRWHAGTHAEGLGLDPAGKFGYVSAQDDHKLIKFTLADFQPVGEVPMGQRPDPIVFIPY